MFEKRLLGLVAALLGLAAAVLILLFASGGGRGVDVLALVIGLGVLYGSYLIYRGKTSLLLGGTKTRMGAIINLALGLLTLVVPGGVGGTESVLALVSGAVGLLAV